jgi:predicted dehydrogenase
MILYDDLEPSEKIKLYDKGATSMPMDEERHELLVSYRYGDMSAPRLDTTEALRTEILHFVDCIKTGSKPLTDGWAGLRVVRILEAAEHSRRTGGGMVQVIPAAEYE